MKVLFLNDTGLVSGAERCLLDLLAVLGDDVEPVVACPRGPLADEVAALGIEVVTTRPLTGSLRLDPRDTPRALAQLAVLSSGVRRLARARDTDLVHANTLRASLVAAGARRLGGPPVATFLHDALPAGRAARATSALIRAQASLLFANSAFTAGRFGLAADDPRLRVVYNPIDLAAFDPARCTRAAARERLGLDADDLVLAVIAQITPWKGQRDALEIVDALRNRHPRVRLLIVGEAKFVARATRYDNERYLAELRELERVRGLEPHVRWLGERRDVPALLAAVDVLLAPSWEEPFGRIVVEAMAMGCLVAATSVGGPAEIVSDGVDGLLLAPRQPWRWAEALQAVLADSAAVERIRSSAPSAAARCDRVRVAREMVDAYSAMGV